MKKCFARIDANTCNALVNKNCNNCKFYKPKSEIKNNIFYQYSFRTKKEYEIALIKYEKKFKTKFKG